MYIRYYNVMLSRSEGHRVIGVSCHVIPSLNKVSYLLTYFLANIQVILRLILSRGVLRHELDNCNCFIIQHIDNKAQFYCRKPGDDLQRYYK